MAKVLGVPRSTLQRDVANNGPENGPQRAASAERPVSTEPPREAYETIVIDPPWPMAKIERDVRPLSLLRFNYRPVFQGVRFA